MKKFLAVLLILGLSLVVFAEGQGEAKKINYPTKPIHMVVPWAAGGGTDAVARVLAKEAEPFLGTTIVVENRTGGGGAVGHSAVSQAKPDGYLIGLTTVELIIQPHIQEVPYSHEEMAPIIQVNSDPAAITVPADSEWDTLEEFLDYARAHPGELQCSGTGYAGIWHIALLDLSQKSGTEFTFVPSQGAAPAVTELLGGHIDFVSCSPPEVAAQVEAGQLKMLAVSGNERHPNFPDVPTMAELGYDVQTTVWRGVQAPKGTPQEIIDILHDAFKKAYESENFKKTMNNVGLGMVYRNGEDFKKMIAESYDTFGEIVSAFDL
ncbi:tripartite tricarboxylate transporter substrate binding protein [Marispirochaeta aestuarii]|uniref:tripartite tricarboxylate transporter substrate binding protein n=1 Tax=Marispirochaeta aestuarii TaxID=1963862 RepID=UPI0029C894C2|nr:tripartite tricarboxylate transporter substrate binding protein [Marispirochaeta aestuarii]